MADTFREVVRQLVLYCPQVPLPLCELWVRDRWRQLCETRNWSFLRGVGQFDIHSSYGEGTVICTNGSPVIEGVDTTFIDDHIGRQIKIPNSPVYTIVSVESVTSLTIDRNFAGPSLADQVYMIVEAYITPPEDFLSFISVVSLQNMWRLNVGYYDSKDIDVRDPRRVTNGWPYLIASMVYSSTSQPFMTPVPMFEMWPHPTAAGAYPFFYLKRTSDFNESFVIPSVVTGDVLRVGALAELCRWPGTEDKPNPMFRLDLSIRYETEWNYKVGMAGKQDNEIYQGDISYEGYPLVPMSANFAQNHGMYEIAAAIT